jgi:hypothetical protein
MSVHCIDIVVRSLSFERHLAPAPGPCSRRQSQKTRPTAQRFGMARYLHTILYTKKDPDERPPSPDLRRQRLD